MTRQDVLGFYKSGVTGISSTLSLVTFAIEIPVGHFPVVGHAKRGWSNITHGTEYLDGHHWTNEVRCVYKNIDWKDSMPATRRDRWALFAYKHQFARDELVNDVDLLGLSLVHSPKRLKWATILVSTFCKISEEARSTTVHSWTKQAYSCLFLFLLFSPRRCK